MGSGCSYISNLHPANDEVTVLPTSTCHNEKIDVGEELWPDHTSRSGNDPYVDGISTDPLPTSGRQHQQDTHRHATKSLFLGPRHGEMACDRHATKSVILGSHDHLDCDDK